VFVRELPDRFERIGNSKELGVEGKFEIILIYKNWNVMMWTGIMWLRIGASKWLPWTGKGLSKKGISFMLSSGYFPGV
jgi:hypothetical protein